MVSDALHRHDGKVLVARVVRTIHDAHTDAHLELDFVLILVLDLVLSVLACSWLCSCHPLWVRSFYLPEVLVGAAVAPLCSRLSRPVSAPRRRRMRAPDSHYLCNVRPLLVPELGCSGSVQSSVGHLVVGMVVDSAVPRVVHFCESLGMPRRWSLCLEGQTAICTFRQALLCWASRDRALGCSGTSCFPSSSESSDQSEYGYDRPAAVSAASCLGLALSASASGARSRRSTVRVVSTLASACDTRSRSCHRCVFAVCLMVSGQISTQTCSN